MTDIQKLNDAIDNEAITMRFGSTRIGRHIKDPYTNRPYDLWKDRQAALNSPAHLSNPNVINFERLLSEAISKYPEEDRWKFEYFLEVPFQNPDVALFNNLYKKFGATTLIKRSWFRADVYFPNLGIIVELDSEKYHTDLDIALDNAKENLIYEYFGIRTIIRVNLACSDEKENKRRFGAVFKALRTLKPIEKPIILYNTILDSWNTVNEELLKFFPYVESSTSNYYTKHETLYKNRDVYLNYNSLPEELKITISRNSIKEALINVYKRIKNVNLVVIKP